LAHVEVVAEADCSSSHEDLGDGKGRHWYYIAGSTLGYVWWCEV
jgi:hypothetical protein